MNCKLLRKWSKKGKEEHTTLRLQTILRSAEEEMADPTVLRWFAFRVLDRKKQLPPRVCETIKREFADYYITEGRWVR